MIRFLLIPAIILLGVDYHNPELRDQAIDMLPEGRAGDIIRKALGDEDRSMVEVAMMWAQDQGTLAYGKLNEVAGGQTASDIYDNVSEQLQGIGLDIPNEGSE